MWEGRLAVAQSEIFFDSSLYLDHLELPLICPAQLKSHLEDLLEKQNRRVKSRHASDLGCSAGCSPPKEPCHPHPAFLCGKHRDESLYS